MTYDELHRTSKEYKQGSTFVKTEGMKRISALMVVSDRAEP